MAGCHVSQWFHADGHSGQQGPLSDAALRALHQAGRLPLHTLVWREGMSHWLPMEQFAHELGLSVSGVMPPPLPSHAPAPPDSSRPPQRPGCALMAVIGIAVGLAMVALLRVLAAIFVPAYQLYLVRGQVGAAHAALTPLTAQVDAYLDRYQRCPANNDDGFGPPPSYDAPMTSEVRIGRFSSGHCGLEAVLEKTDNAALHGKLLWLERDPDNGLWHCSSDLEDKYLPVPCRG